MSTGILTPIRKSGRIATIKFVKGQSELLSGYTAGNNKQAAWCYYNNDTVNRGKYGKLYNWYAVADPRGLSPDGYRVPSHGEWGVLIRYLGSNASVFMKNETGWEENLNGKNKSGFSAMPAGKREIEGFDRLGIQSIWWGATESGPDSSWDYYLNQSTTNYLGTGKADKAAGFSIRCLKNQ